jgi:hypothetical protein
MKRAIERDEGKRERTMPVQRVHPRKRLLAALTRERPDVEMQVLVALAVVLARERLGAARPLALVRLLLVVGPEMACINRRVTSITLGHR